MSGKQIVNIDTNSREIHMKQDTMEAIVKPVKGVSECVSQYVCPSLCFSLSLSVCVSLCVCVFLSVCEC